MQIRQVSERLRIRQLDHVPPVFRQRQRIDAVRRIHLEPDIRGRGSSAIRTGGGAHLRMQLTVGIDLCRCRPSGTQADDARLFQRQQLARVGDTVAVRIAPDAQLGKPGIGGIHHAVPILIQFLQRLVAIRGPLPVLQQGIGAEQFATGVDAAIVVQIAHQKTIVRPHPGGAFPHAVGVVVEMDVVAQRLRFHAVAVQVDDDGRPALLGRIHGRPAGRRGRRIFGNGFQVDAEVVVVEVFNHQAAIDGQVITVQYVGCAGVCILIDVLGVCCFARAPSNSLI